MSARMRLPLAVVMWAGCALRTEVVPDLRPLLKQVEQRLQEQAETIASLEENLTYSLCSEELATFLRDVRDECESAAASAQKAAGSPASERSEPCRAGAISTAIWQDEQTYQLRFAAALAKAQHAVAYLAERPAASSSGKDDLLPRRRKREERIARLLRIPNLPTSRFVLVASPEKPNAEGRLRWLRTFLLEHGVSPDRIDRPLLYDLRLSPSETPPVDRPVPPSETDPGSAAVWIFRINCKGG